MAHDGGRHRDGNEWDSEQHLDRRASDQAQWQDRDQRDQHRQEQPQKLAALDVRSAAVAYGQRCQAKTQREGAAYFGSGPERLQGVVAGESEVTGRYARFSRPGAGAHLKREQRRGHDNGRDDPAPAR